MIAAFDTETSGLWRDDLPALDPSQPNLVQIAVRAFSPKGRPVAGFSCLIKPDGWSMQPGAQAVHGVSEADCYRYGLPLALAMGAFQAVIADAMVVVAHNMDFDRKVVAAAINRAGGVGAWWLKKAPAMFCTMEQSKDVCQLPGQFDDFKFPTLLEAHNILLPTVPYTARHEAGEDATAAFRVYQALMLLSE